MASKTRALRTIVCHDKGKIWELVEDRRQAPDQAGNTGEGRDHFPEEATPEMSATGCLKSNQAEGLRKTLEEEEQSPFKGELIEIRVKTLLNT